MAFFPGREREADQRRLWKQRPKIPGLAHLWHLFVLPQRWGRGVAPVLHAAVAQIRVRGFERARLFTRSLHARGRRFYERRGWAPEDEQWNSELQLMLTEYRLAIVGR